MKEDGPTSKLLTHSMCMVKPVLVEPCQQNLNVCRTCLPDFAPRAMQRCGGDIARSATGGDKKARRLRRGVHQTRVLRTLDDS